MIAVVVIIGLVGVGFAIGYGLRDMISRRRRRRARELDGPLF
jgi:hypothetical protein